MALFHFTADQIKRSEGQSGFRCLPFRGKTPQRLLWRGQRLHQKERRYLFRNSPAAPCTEGVCRPGNPLERRRTRRAWEESPACIQL